jgi:uncharacterized protein YecT (DUF1311 family)
MMEDMRFPTTATIARGLASLFLAALPALPLSAHAQAGAACDPASDATASRNACAVQAFQEADTALNIRYLDIMQQLPQGKRTGLRHDQNGWIKGRTARCKAATRDTETRPEGPRLYHECLVAATRERMQALEHWLQH